MAHVGDQLTRRDLPGARGSLGAWSRLTETSYVARPEGVVAVARRMRRVGTGHALSPHNPNINRMAKEGGTLAVTIHLYGFCPDQHSNSVRETYRLAA